MKRGESVPPSKRPSRSRPRKSGGPRSAATNAAGGGGRWTRVAIAVALALVGGAAFAFFSFSRRAHAGVGRAVDVEVPAGASDDEVGARLVAAGVIDSSSGFLLYAKLSGGLHATVGLHLLSDDLSYVEVLRRLRRSGGSTKVKVTIPEGWNRFDIAKRLREKRVCDEASFLAATTDRALLDELELRGAPSAEGWLFPATYELPADGDAREVVRRLVDEGHARFNKLTSVHGEGLGRLGAQLHFGPQEVMTLASVIEKEAVVDDERPIIASVFLNRLREPESGTGGKLQADPTAGYGCLVAAPTPPTCVGWLRAGSSRVNAEIQHDPQNAWSTYTHAGLPPTPIASPGERSIEAVLAPATTRFFYFVAKGGGRHTFSETLERHERATNPR
jgi:UPF0755 protein